MTYKHRVWGVETDKVLYSNLTALQGLCAILSPQLVALVGALWWRQAGLWEASSRELRILVPFSLPLLPSHPVR